MKTLVLGGAGYVGSVLCPQLTALGQDVTVIDRFFFGRPRELTSDKKITLLRKDVRGLTVNDFSGFDWVLDLAGLSNDPSCDLDPSYTRGINVAAGLDAARMAKEAGVSRYFYMSSCSVYGEGQGEWLKEEAPTRPVSEYAKAKFEVEQTLLPMNDAKFCLTTFRTATVYGLSPRFRLDLLINIMTYYAFFKNRIMVLGGGKQWRPLVHVRDVVEAIVTAMQAPAAKVGGRIFNCGSNGQNLRVIQVANMVKGVMPQTEIDIIPDDPDKRSYHICFDRIEDELEFKAKRSPVDGILEIRDAFMAGHIDADDPRTNTVRWLKYLIDAKKRIEEVELDGRIL